MQVSTQNICKRRIHGFSRNEILKEIVEKLKSVTTNLDERLEPECFDRWMHDIPHEVIAFKNKLQEVNDLEAEKKKRHKNAMKRKGEIVSKISSLNEEMLRFSQGEVDA